MDASGFESRWRRRFDDYAKARDDDAGIAGWTATGLDARVRKFSSLWNPPPAVGRWLDAGCGAGTYVRIISGRGMQVIGVDYSPASVTKARARDSSGGLYAVADARRLPLRRQTFDGVVCFGVTQALLSSNELVGELASMVAPSGELWVDGLNAHCLAHIAGRIRRRVLGRRMHLRYVASSEIMRLMRETGLIDIKRYWLPIAPPRMRNLQRFFEHPYIDGLFNFCAPVGALASHSFIVQGRRPSR